MIDLLRIRSLGALGAFALAASGCGPDPEGSEPIDLEFRNGGSSGGRGGASSSGGSGGRGGQGGSSTGRGGNGGSGGSITPSGPPEVAAMDPESGPYGELVTIAGSALGGAGVPGSRLLVGSMGEVELFPDSEAIDSWTDELIVFRYPFPATGAVSVETDWGVALAGYFDPTWIAVTTFPSAPAASVIASLSHAPGSLFLLFDTSPPTLLELGPDGVREYAVALNGALASSVRLYLAESGELEGIGLSDDPEPELIHLTNSSGDLIGEATGIQAETAEVALAGGPDGACVWMNGSTGWLRARPGASGWAEDVGPVAEPATGGDRAFGASSDGTLYLGWSVDSGNFVDDMQRPVMRKLSGATGEWSGQTNAGASVDDYVTSLDIFDKGRGVVVRYCGSDVDPTGLSGTEYRCYDGAFSQGGSGFPQLAVDQGRSGYAFSAARVAVADCDSESTFRVAVDDQTSSETVLYPCQTPVALEIDPDGEFLPVVRAGTTLYLLGRRPQ